MMQDRKQDKSFDAGSDTGEVIGLCRFSYPAEGGFQVSHDTVEARRAYLYDPRRMAARFASFETMTLPSIRAQSDADFRFLILVDDALPAAHRTRLDALVAGVPQIEVVARRPGPHRKVCQQVINAARDRARPCFQFRLDDDDAIALGFVARLRAVARDIAPLLATHPMLALDFNRGYVARLDAAGLCATETTAPYWTPGLAMRVPAGTHRSIMNFAHQKLARFMPTLTFTDAPMFVRGHNDHNDSRQGAHVSPLPLPRLDAAGEALFRNVFAIDADRVRACLAPGLPHPSPPRPDPIGAPAVADGPRDRA